MKINEKLLFWVFCLPAVMSFCLVFSVPIQKPDGNSINIDYLGTVEGKSFFAEKTTYRNWTEAKRYCEQIGMHLATINSAAQTTLLVNAYNNVTFHGGKSFWTGGRDAQAASQFVWDNTEEMLDTNINKFGYFSGIQTCVDWYTTFAIGGRLESDPCTIKLSGVLCEINNG